MEAAAAEFQRFAASRHSVRRYEARPVPAPVVDTVLGCALSAPSPHNRQPVRLALVQDPKARMRLADAMGARLRRDRLADGDAPEAVESDIARSRARLLGAPVLVLVGLSLEDMDSYPDAARREAERLMAVQAAAMAGQNVALAAHAAGLASCWICAPLFCPETARAVLELPRDWEPQGLMTIGYGRAPVKPRPRKSLQDILLRF